MADPAPEGALKGVPASPGFAIGPALLITPATGPSSPGGPSGSGPTPDGKAALDQALESSANALNRLRQRQGDLAADILEFQVALIDDDDLIGPVYRRIEAGEPADTAWRAVLDEEITGYRSADDDYMAARAHDLVDLRDRVLRALTGVGDCTIDVPEGAILVAADLSPSAFLELDWRKLAGVVLEGCSPTSHVAILARARGVPMIVGLDTGGEAAAGDTVVLDGDIGTLIIRPGPEALVQAEARLVEASALAAKAAAVADQPAVTRNGEMVTILVNVDDPAALDGIDPACCDGIGLARTEFLFHQGSLPGEDEQTEIYEKLIRWASGRPVTIRTVDAGGDKPVPGMTIDDEQNPFLGVRGLRLSLLKPAIFMTQLRALARAAAQGPLKVMLPMVTTPSELEQARGHLDVAMQELDARSIAAARPALGIMVETPAAALMADMFEADFYSIGSNDLIQYVTACARDESALAHLADPENPAVLELIERTVSAGHRRQVDVSLCGDMASDAALAQILIKRGLRTLSVAPAQVGRVKLALAACDAGTRNDR